VIGGAVGYEKEGKNKRMTLSEYFRDSIEELAIAMVDGFKVG
jgi:hypothetical protein